MRPRARLRVLTAAAVLAFVAPAAIAQETQQELAERIVKEQEDLRRSAVQKALGAPARAWDHVDEDPYAPVGVDPASAAPAPAAAPPKPARPRAPGGGPSWVLIACLLPVIPLALLAVASWRKFRFDGR